MYEYKIKLPFKVENCLSCPFRREQTTFENIQSADVLSGVINISRRVSTCTIKEETIFMVESVESYNSKCPLKGNIVFIDDKK